MLNPSDVYVSGGSNDLLVCWTDKVTKYDASSFYNWEQDNLPLHDLDERTHLLWEKLGHPTSALTGMSFIVSADATDSCSPLYFTNLSSCVAALPEVINYPILIEVASFGNLGGLTLSNKSFGPNGSLEIINRNSAFGGAADVSGNGMTAQEYDSAYTDYKLASAIVPIGIAATNLQGGASSPALTYDMQSAQMYVNGQYISSAVNRWADARYASNNTYVFSRKVSGKQYNRLTAALDSAIDAWNTGAASYAEASSFKFEAYDKSRTESKIDEYDVSTLNLLKRQENRWGNGTEDGGDDTAAAAFAYFNKLDYIKISNCDGPIYIRNFNVDGQHSIARGIEVKNSFVNLERCSVSRCTEAGLYCDNSEVNLLRGFVAYRNYGFEGGVRIGVSFAEKRNNYVKQDSYGAGIYALNSTIDIESTYTRDYEKSLEASSNVYDSYTGGIPVPSMQALYCLSRNDIGIHCVNSNLVGGRTELNGSSTANGTSTWKDATQLTLELNTEAGLKLNNSFVNYSGRLIADGNYFGIDSNNSKLELDRVAARHNQSVGINLLNSQLVYNKDLYAGYLRGQNPQVGAIDFKLSQIACWENAQGIKCDNSTIKPLYTASMPSLYEMVYVTSSFGIENEVPSLAAGITLLPSIEAINNSNLDLIHTHIDRETLDNDMPKASEPTYGAMARALSNSKITFRGSKHYSNTFLGPTGRGFAHPLAAVYAGDQSTVSFQGPTVIAQVGVDVLCDKQSVMRFEPHVDAEDGLLVSSFDLSGSPDNHTMVELHSTRACLVADQQSLISMKDLGDYVRIYEGSPSVSARGDNYSYGLTDLHQICVSNGWMQLYPNANIDDPDVANDASLPAANNASRYRFVSDSSILSYRYLKTLVDFELNASTITTGGMSVRALGDSLVDVVNVHFPCGWANASGYVYDLEGALPLAGPVCSRIHIWNIADNSLLRASYLSISGLHPVDAPYHGPSGTWGVSAAPSSTPDTSSLSVLDYYGSSVDNFYGKASIQNLGPFRLYFSIDPACKFLDVSDAGRGFGGVISQVFSQGYNFSGNVIAYNNPDYHASANYTSLLRRNEAGTIQASGFYYASEMLSNPDTILASLDDSAANSFANAKHNSVDKSLIGKRVDIYYPTDGYGGDVANINTNNVDFGKGLLSVNNFDLRKDN
jgi:hypothetical protein